MISRRRFLEVGGVTAGMAAASQSLVATAAAANVDDASLPPSLARLKSRKSEATPIPREERHERQERARQLMSENGLDAIVLMEGTSLRYFTGIRWWGGERTFALILPAKGAAFYVCPAFEEGRAREQISNSPDGAQARHRHGQAWDRRDCSLRFCEWHREGSIPSDDGQRDSRHRGMPNDQERA
jgi:Xaa-Pro dipeptidase